MGGVVSGGWSVGVGSVGGVVSGGVGQWWVWSVGGGVSGKVESWGVVTGEAWEVGKWWCVWCWCVVRLCV